MKWQAHGEYVGQPPETWPATHDAGCVYGGFSCGYWLRFDGCPEQHWERHITADEYCPCGTHFPGAPTGEVVFDATDGRS